MSSILKLHKDIFDRSSIVSGVRAYQSLANIHIEEDKSYWICSFTNCVYEPELTQREFENYVIDLMNTQFAHGYS